MLKLLYFCLALMMTTNAAFAMLVGNFPGLPQLVDKADAIVVLRVDDELGPPLPFADGRRVSCYVYQVLKGNIMPGTTTPMLLINMRPGLVTPFARGSTHLMFLTKSDGDTPYQTLMYDGANIAVSPLGQEKPPQGRSVVDKVRAVIEASIQYRKQSTAEEIDYLNKLIQR
jgi:hypothetical protein